VGQNPPASTNRPIEPKTDLSAILSEVAFGEGGKPEILSSTSTSTNTHAPLTLTNVHCSRDG
jgi:hypothetical protein